MLYEGFICAENLSEIICLHLNHVFCSDHNRYISNILARPPSISMDTIFFGGYWYVIQAGILLWICGQKENPNFFSLPTDRRLIFY